MTRYLIWTLLVASVAMTGCGSDGAPFNPNSFNTDTGDTVTRDTGKTQDKDVNTYDDEWTEDEWVEDQQVEDQWTDDIEIKCPTAVIEVAEGNEVVPPTFLHLSGINSHGSSEIKQWEWSVEQPDGPQSVFEPPKTTPNPIFEANVVGTYVFRLDVWDAMGQKSCEPAIHEVQVIPDEPIHIELFWHTPDDPDETDTGAEAGSDLDLHFVHPWAEGPDLDEDGEADRWFDNLFDCFWFNAHPNWGSYDPATPDDPSLDLDDTDGAGPEIISLGIPEDVTYRVGVHYWNAHGFGVSYATVRVYIYATLVFEKSDVMLSDRDMWEVCTIEWPSEEVVWVSVDGDHKITPNYENPYFVQQ